MLLEMNEKTQQIILEMITQSDLNVAVRIAEKAGVSRQTASKWLQDAQKSGLIESAGSGRGIRYRLATLINIEKTYSIDGLPVFGEDHIWRQFIFPTVDDLANNVLGLWQYGTMEMINNAIDHSNGTEITVGVQRNAVYTTVYVADNGEGIFLKLQREFNLYDPRESILELAKGKLTTDPKNHSGEGIFFTSKSMDSFAISSGDLLFQHDANSLDILMEKSYSSSGTLVMMRLANHSQRLLNDVYNQFASSDAFDFDSTIIPVRLAKYENEGLVSRSQAKRLTLRFESFKFIILDFSGLTEIGQGFADQVFRVFQNDHTEIVMTVINANDHHCTTSASISNSTFTHFAFNIGSGSSPTTGPPTKITFSHCLPSGFTPITLTIAIGEFWVNGATSARHVNFSDGFTLYSSGIVES